MPITKSFNAKANIKQKSDADIPFAPRSTVIASYTAEATDGQTVINLGFSVDQTNTDIFFLFIDGKKATLGTGNNFVFTNIDQNGYSSQVTLYSPMSAGISIEAYKLAAKKDNDVNDNRWLQNYEVMQKGFQPFVAPSYLTAVNGTPSTGQFRSSITGRAPIIDIANDLRASMGVERIMTQQLFEIQNEFGPNGERVFSSLNDDKGLMRFVGGWSSIITNNGIFVYPSSSTSDFFEITFYGTGLNIFTYVDVAIRDLRVSVDGGAEGSNIWAWGTSGSTVLNARTYSPNQLVPATIPLSLGLGLHTVKIRNNHANGFAFYGVEVLNESSSIKTNPGIAYIDGKKVVSSTLSSLAYNSGFTNIYGTVGTKGGHVLEYMDALGNIKKDIRYTEVSQGTLASADHTNEEVVRTYDFREFGAGRNDDFSLMAAANLAFTLDDGTTTLVGSSVIIPSTANGLGISTNGGSITITFVGTGLDINYQDSVAGGSDTYNFQIDGGSTIAWPYTAGSTTRRVLKLVSGLPWGTHVIRLNRVAATTWTLAIFKFIVYGPKKPVLPSGTIELSDYFLFSDFVANTIQGTDNLATGIMRKVCCREMTYVGTWTITSPSVNEPCGADVGSSTTGDYIQYTFFGTGLDVRFASNSSGGTWRFFIDGSNVLSGFTTSSYGPGVSSFTAATGDLVTTGTGSNGNGVRISGISCGVHTIKIQKTAGTGPFYLETMDIITPIYSPKSNLYADIQNTLTVGSNSLSDNRKFTPVKESLPAQKAWAQAVGVLSSTTTTVTAAVPCPDMSVTIKTSGNSALRISYSCMLSSSGAFSCNTQLYLDGAPVGTMRGTNPYTGTATIVNADSIRVPVSAGVHKVDLYWYTSSGTLTANSVSRDLLVEEI